MIFALFGILTVYVISISWLIYGFSKVKKYQNEGLKDKNRILTLSYLFLNGNYAQLDSIRPFNQNNIISDQPFFAKA